MNKNKIILIGIFTSLLYIALQIPFSIVLGSNTKFTLFDFTAPAAGAFLTTIPGIISVLLAQLANIFIHKSSLEPATFIRIIPTLYGVFYFAKKRTVNPVIPLLAIAAFNLHPIGRSAWQYSMFWFIPLIAHFFRKNLFFRSLGATFAAHSVGGALWVWTFGLSQNIWLSLIPQTAMERTLFASGIAVSFLIATNFFRILDKIQVLKEIILEKRYLLKKP
jgi:hypothetical protein